MPVKIASIYLSDEVVWDLNLLKCQALLYGAGLHEDS